MKKYIICAYKWTNAVHGRAKTLCNMLVLNFENDEASSFFEEFQKNQGADAYSLQCDETGLYETVGL